MSLRMHHLSLRMLATLGLSLAAIADLLSVLSTGWPALFLTVRFLGGPGLAALFVDGGRYDRAFMMGIVLFILAVIGFSIANRGTISRAPLPL